MTVTPTQFEKVPRILGRLASTRIAILTNLIEPDISKDLINANANFTGLYRINCKSITVQGRNGVNTRGDASWSELAD